MNLFFNFIILKLYYLKISKVKKSNDKQLFECKQINAKENFPNT